VNGRLYRSGTDRVFSGLCGGMGDYFGIDPTLVRLAWVVLAIVTAVIPLLFVYIVMAIVVPEEPPEGSPEWAAWVGPSWGAPGAPGAPGTPGAGAAPGSAPADAGTAAAGPSAGQSGQPGQSSGTSSWGTGWNVPPPPGADWRTQRAYMRAQRRAQRAYWRSQRWSGDSGTVGLVFGVILVLVGGVFLLQTAIPSVDSSVLWPLALIVIGAALLVGAFRR
jgi:phage shock protein C